LHEKNLELLHAGVFNAWTENSLGKLAELVPGRYAKNELTSDSLGTIDRYVYRSPASLIYGPTLADAGLTPGGEPAETTQLAPMPVNDGVVEDASPQ